MQRLYNVLKYADGGMTVDRVQQVIDRYSGGKSPFSAMDYLDVSRATGVPVGLLLAQGIQESNLGTKGVAVRTRNVANVGNFNDTTGKETNNDTWKAGLYRQALLLKNEYGVNGESDVQRLFSNNFMRPAGGYYATASDYGSKVGSLYSTITGNNIQSSNQSSTDNSRVSGGSGINLQGSKPDIQGFYGELKQRFPNMRVTSGLRTGNGVGKAGSKSWHNQGLALDLAPDENLKQFLTSPDGYKLMYKYNLGFLDETDPATMKKTGATGKHFHIGRDSALVNKNTFNYNRYFSEEEQPNAETTTGTTNADSEAVNLINSLRGDITRLEQGNYTLLQQQQGLTAEQQEQLYKEQQEKDYLQQQLDSKERERQIALNTLPTLEFVDTSPIRNDYIELLKNNNG
ncbi:MAG: glucosaminidase domain-containing protein [Lachnospiraceae bacterium]|jgi:hypothetical protein|nr:glucosaminidase domain-containing protein [Lachnospiraceae bacterium]